MSAAIPAYLAEQPTRVEIDALTGSAVLDFGTNWCGHCNGAASKVEEALAGRADIRHLKAEDGSGRPLGRSFGVKLWPTLVFLQDGREVGRLVRPIDSAAVSQALDLLAAEPDASGQDAAPDTGN